MVVPGTRPQSVSTPGGAYLVVGADPADGVADPAGDRRQLLAAIGAQLGSANEARWIVEHVEQYLGLSPTDGVGHQAARHLADRRSAGEPLQYVLGRWPFRCLDLAVDARVLIPRPETEQVVEVALAELHRARGGSETADALVPPPVCVDLGTGSGAIGLSLAVEGSRWYPDLQVWATDRSDGALEVAAANLADLSSRADLADLAIRVHLVQGTWFEALPTDLVGRVDLLVSNPPYVSEAEYPLLDPVVRQWEPAAALVAARGADGVAGMSDIEAVLSGATRWLGPSGAVVVEMAPHQAGAAADAARRAGFAQVSVQRDLAGRLRMLVARR
jgi:release factor glutamine methyltransferase